MDDSGGAVFHLECRGAVIFHAAEGWLRPVTRSPDHPAKSLLGGEANRVDGVRGNPEHESAVLRTIRIPRGTLAEAIALLCRDQCRFANLSGADDFSRRAEFFAASEIEFGQHALSRFARQRPNSFELFPCRCDWFVADDVNSALERRGDEVAVLGVDRADSYDVGFVFIEQPDRISEDLQIPCEFGDARTAGIVRGGRCKSNGMFDFRALVIVRR